MLVWNIGFQHLAFVQDSRNRRCNIHKNDIALFDSRSLLPVNMVIPTLPILFLADYISKRSDSLDPALNHIALL